MGEFNQAKYIQQYQKEKYDRCIFNLPKGKKQELQRHYTKKGFTSLNQYVNELIRQDMNEENNTNINIGEINQSGDNSSVNIQRP